MVKFLVNKIILSYLNYDILRYYKISYSYEDFSICFISAHISIALYKVEINIENERLTFK